MGTGKFNYRSYSERLRSIFNRLLASLVILDNCFLLLTLLEILRQQHMPNSEWMSAAFALFIFPMRNIFLCCTIYVAIALAIERYRAIRYGKLLVRVDSTVD